MPFLGRLSYIAMHAVVHTDMLSERLSVPEVPRARMIEVALPADGIGALNCALFPHAAFDLVVIAASAGGVTVLKDLLSRLPVPFATPIALVQHLSPFYPSVLSEVFGWKSRLHTQFARHGERLRSGSVYVAPPDRHLVIGPQRRLELEDSPKCHYVRPAADRLFTSAAEQLGPRLLCVVLTGMGCDGARGAAAVKEHGGIVIVQDPATADADSMPRATLHSCSVDFVLPPAAIPSALTSLCGVIGTRELFCGPAPQTSVQSG